MRLLIVVVCSLLASCAANQKDNTKPPYSTDFLSLQMLKATNTSPEDRIIRITGSTSDLDERWYYDQCFNKIADLNRGKSPRHGSARFEYMVDLEGSLISVRVLKSSGNLELDNHLKSLIQRSEPFPAPPKSISFRAHKIGLIQTLALTKRD